MYYTVAYKVAKGVIHRSTSLFLSADQILGACLLLMSHLTVFMCVIFHVKMLVGVYGRAKLFVELMSRL